MIIFDEIILKEGGISISINDKHFLIKHREFYRQKYKYLLVQIENGELIKHRFIYDHKSWRYSFAKNEWDLNYGFRSIGLTSNPIIDSSLFTKMVCSERELNDHLDVIKRKIKIENIIDV